jgi:hypothetical protein
MKIVNYIIHYLFKIHNWTPKLSRYISFSSRDILYECSCGKRKINKVVRDFDTPFPIETTMLMTKKEMQNALLKGVEDYRNIT